MTHRRDIAAADDPGSRASSSARGSVRARGRALRGARGDLVGAFAPHASWTSAATHAVLPLLATSAGARPPGRAGIASHREALRALERAGFWLPECGHAPWLDPLLEEAGVHAFCLDLTDGSATARPPSCSRCAARRPAAGAIDRALMDLVWHHSGYPSAAAYRDTATTPSYRPRRGAVDGRALTTRRAGRAGFARTAREFAEAAARQAGERRARGLPLDTELLGHFWHEGVDCAGGDDRGGATRRGSSSCRSMPRWPASTPCRLRRAARHELGEPRDLATWSAPPAAELAWQAREAELRVLATGAHPAPRARARADGPPGLRLGVRRDSPDRRPLLAGAALATRRASSARLADRPESVPAWRNLAPSLDLSNRELQVS